MHESLRANLACDCTFILFAFDSETVEIIRAYSQSSIQVIPIENVERKFGLSRSALNDRSEVEYMFTFGPLCILFTRMRYPEAVLTFVDSDYYFFSTPIEFLCSSPNVDMRFISHSFAPRYRYLETHGHFNVGWNTFFPTSGSYCSLRRWALLSIEWCRDQVVPGRFAEQKYLDYLDGESARVEGIYDGRMGLAEYNFFQYNILISCNDQNHLDLLLEESPVISWHFHGIRETADGPSIRINIEEARNSLLYQQVYSFYLKKLEAMESRLASLGLSPGYGNLRI